MEFIDHDPHWFTCSLASNPLTNAYNGWGLRAGEWRAQGQRANALLGNLTHMLNLNEQFEMNDSFNLLFVHIRNAPRGSGKQGTYLPGHQSSTHLKQFKKSVLRIQEDDDTLCCPRAIVTARGVHQANVTTRRRWTCAKQNQTRVTRAAPDLLEEVDLLPRPCGPEELHLLASAPTLEGYTIVVVDANRAFACFAYGNGDTILGLLHEDGHYDALSSLPGFFGKSYFCAPCFRPYNNEGQHACPKNRHNHCGACLQKGCTDHIDAYRHYKSPNVRCEPCGRSFYGDVCLNNHQSRTVSGKPKDLSKPSVCATRRKCKECHALLRGIKEIRTHQCGFRTCRCCKEMVDVRRHRCYLQKEKPPMEPEDDNPPVPLHVFFDIECMQVHGNHVPNLVVAETETHDCPLWFKGDECISMFLEWLETLTENGTRLLTVLAHNFKGYGSYPIINELHRQKRQIEQVRNGGKVLQLTYAHEDTTIRFIDSLSFFQMSLSHFPKTFGLHELKKGWFPHLFNTPENQSYVGPTPDKSFYMPEGMSIKK